jgi:hypothetical protein
MKARPCLAVGVLPLDGSGQARSVGEDGEDAAVLVGRLGRVELVEDLGDMGFDGAFGDQWPGGDGPVGHALGDRPETCRLVC